MRLVVLTSCVALSIAAVALADNTVDPLAELTSLGNSVADNSQQGGGSIRAKRDVDPTLAIRLKDGKNVEGRVESVTRGKFPAAVIKLKVVNPAKEGAGKDVNKNDSLVVVPKFKVDKGQLSLSEPEAIINAGTFYLHEGDKVAVRLTGKHDKVWEADYIERM